MATNLVMHIIILIYSPLKLSDGDVDSEDYVELTVDKLVYGEVSESICHSCLIGAIQFFLQKTYVPMKPVRSVHNQSARVAANKFDNPYFDVSVNRTKGLLEDIQVAMDCTEASPAVENPPQSPTENCQPLTIFRLKNEEVALTSSNKTLSRSPFTYSTPGELEKLQTGTFSLPRSTGPIKTPRRRMPAVTKSPVNKGIPTPAPCKPTTTNTDEEPSVVASNEPLTMDDNDKELEPIITDINDKHPPTATDNAEQPLTIADTEEPPIMANNDKEPLTMDDNDEDLEPVTTAVNDEHPPTTADNVDPLTIADVNEEEPRTMENNYDKLLITANNDELITTTINDEGTPTTVANTDELLTTADNNLESLTTDK